MKRQPHGPLWLRNRRIKLQEKQLPPDVAQHRSVVVFPSVLTVTFRILLDDALGSKKRKLEEGGLVPTHHTVNYNRAPAMQMP